MAAEGGLVVAVRIKVAGVYTPLAALKTKTIKINNGQLVDVSNSDSVGRFRELLAGVGLISMQITAAGIAKFGAEFTAMESSARTNTFADLQIYVPGIGDYQAMWQISDLSLNAPHNEAVDFTATFESAGAITLTAPGS